MSFFHSITFRFTLWYLLVLAALLLLLSIGVFFNLSHTLHQDLDEALQVRARQLSSTSRILGQIADDRFEESIGEIITFFYESPDGIIALAPRNKSLPLEEELVQAVIEGTSQLITLRTTDGKELRVYGMPTHVRLPPRLMGADVPPRPRRGHPESPEGRRSSNWQPDRAPHPQDPFMLPPPLPLPFKERTIPAAIFVARDTESMQQAIDRLLHILHFALPLTLLIAGGGGIFLARKALRPVEEITKTAQRIEENDLSKRIGVHTQDELGRLSQTLNEMIARLERAFKRQKQFTGDASHELRAPLTVIEAESTLALQKERSIGDYRASLSIVAQEAHRMSLMIDQLLSLARADAGAENLALEEVPFQPLLKKLCAERKKQAHDKGLILETHLTDPATLSGNPQLLGLLFANLLENAIRYTPSGGRISVDLQHEGMRIEVRISDTGIGIAPEDLPHIFERFYRADKARSRAEGSHDHTASPGSGLGLAICKQIAEMHGGTIRVESAPGQGSTFAVSFQAG